MPHSSIIHVDPLIPSTLHLDPLNICTLRLDPHSSSILRPDPICTSLPSLEPSSLNSSSCLNSLSTSTPNLDRFYLHQGPAAPGPQSTAEVLTHPKPFTSSVASPDTNPKAKGSQNHQNGNPVVVPLPDPPPNSCLKTGTPTNHKVSRSSSRVGLRVHFKLPEDEEGEQSDAYGQSDEDSTQMSINKEPPPVRAKPKL